MSLFSRTGVKKIRHSRPPQSFTPNSANRAKLHRLFVEENIWSATLKMALPGMLIALMSGLYLFVDQILIIKLIPNDGVHDLAHMPVLNEKFTKAREVLAELAQQYPNSADQISGIGTSFTIASIVRRSISYSGALTAMFSAVTLLFSVGTATRYSYYLGKNQIQKAREVFSVGSVMTIVATILISIVIYFVNTQWLGFQIDDGTVANRPDFLQDDTKWAVINAGIQGASDLSVQWASDFVVTLVWFVVVQGLFTTIQYSLRSEGKTAIPMAIAIGTNALNVLLEWVFLSPGKLGIEGGAWATVIGWCVSLCSILIYTFYLLRRGTTIIRIPNIFKISRGTFSRAQAMFILNTIWLIAVVGLASFTRNAAASLTGTLQNNSFAYVAGAEAGAYLASFGGIFPLWILVFPVFLGIIQGATNVTAYNYGAANYERVKQSYWIVILMGFIFGLFIYLVLNLGMLRYILQAFEIYPGNAQFNLSLQMAERWMVNAPFQALTLGAILLYQSTNRPLMSLITSALSGVIVYIPMVFIFREVSNFNVWVFIWCTPVTVMVSGVIATAMAFCTMRYRLGKSKKDIANRMERAAVAAAHK